MLSRVAWSIYWMMRYLERADNVARFVDVNTHLLMDLGMKPDKAQWLPLVMTSGDEEDFNARYEEANERNVVQFLTFDGQNPNSILSCIEHARENARTIREAIPSEQWETLNELYHLVQKHQRKRAVSDLKPFYRDIKKAYQQFCGVAENAMSRGQGWHFARVGQLIERADKTARLIDVKYFLLLPKPDMVSTPIDTVQWGAVLKSASAFEMYRKRFHRLHYQDVAEFLLCDEQFPRSVQYCLDHTEKSLAQICAQLDMEPLDPVMTQPDIEQVLSTGLHEYIDAFQLALNALDQSIYQRFFA